METPKNSCKDSENKVARTYRVDLSTTDDSSAAGLISALEATGRYRRDTRLGGILHWGKVSLREVASEESVHLVMEGNRLHAHIDRYSPLNCEERRKRQYSLPAVIVHNVADVVAAGFRALAGRRRDRCEFTCEKVWVEDTDEPEISGE